MPRYASLYYSNSILLLTILSATSASIPSTIATPRAPPRNPAPSAAATVASVLTPEQWEADFTNTWGINAVVGEYGRVRQITWDNMESRARDRHANA